MLLRKLSETYCIESHVQAHAHEEGKPAQKESRCASTTASHDAFLNGTAAKAKRRVGGGEELPPSSVDRASLHC